MGLNTSREAMGLPEPPSFPLRRERISDRFEENIFCHRGHRGITRILKTKTNFRDR
jgi:hypothetical protein